MVHTGRVADHSLVEVGFVVPGRRSLMSIIRVTDDSTEAEITEAIAHLSALPACETRTERTDALLDHLNEMRRGANTASA